MPKLILIGGELATGKTTLARSLSEILSIPCFIKDTMKEALGDAIPCKDREENKRLSVGVFNIFLNISNQFIKTNDDLILESNFKQNEIDELQKIFSKTNYEVISIVLSGDDEILYERYLNRFRFENRNPVHANFSSKEEFIEYNSMLKKVKYFGKIIKLNSDTFVDSKKISAML